MFLHGRSRRVRTLALGLSLGLLLLAALVLLLARGTGRAGTGAPGPGSAADATPGSTETAEGSRAATGSAGPVGSAPASDRGAEDPDAALWALLRSEPPARDLAEVAVRMGRLSAEEALLAMTPEPRPSPALGDSQDFWLHDISGQAYFSVTARLEAIGPEAYLWVQSDQAFDPAALERGALAFSEEVLPAVRSVFGSEWSPGIDGDPRLHILHHEPIAGIAGYFYSADEYPRAVEPHSNQREMFYINLAAATPGSFDYLSLLAHELQHMIHWNRDRDEAVWVNEGLSELSALVAGYRGQTGAAFMEQPDTALMEWQHETGANGPHYAAAFSFLAYLRQRYGDALIQAIVAAPGNGAHGIEEALAAVGAEADFEQVFLDWTAANLVHAPGRGPLGRRYGYGDLAIGRAQPLPLPAEGVQETVQPFGTDAFEVTALVREGRLALDFDGDPRVGLLEASAESGGPVWWSNRGDNMSSRLTRRLDLRGTQTAALELDLWHSMEPHWDYAYIQVSPDGGATWQALPTSRSSDENPNGNNFGAGITGESGAWLSETIDLGAFAGREILLRIEALTDDAVNQSGIALRAPRLRTDAGLAALADEGWEAEGWLHLDPVLPQRWGLQTIVLPADLERRTEGLVVRRHPVAPDGSASIALEGIPPDARVIVTASALTPATRQPAAYRLSAPAFSD